jgi:hypothetical protein
MLRDEPNGATSVWKNDYTVQQFLRTEKVNIPLVEMHKFGGPDDRFHFTIMSRSKGSTMHEIWGTLTWEQKTDIAQDLKDCIKKWRKITRRTCRKQTAQSFAISTLVVVMDLDVSRRDITRKSG